MENYTFEDPSFDSSRQYEFLKGIVESIEAQDSDRLTKVVRDNARIMSLDKANSKLLVEIKKLHCPDNAPAPANPLPMNPDELDLVNGGDDVVPSKGMTGNTDTGKFEEPADDGPAYDLC